MDDVQRDDQMRNWTQAAPEDEQVQHVDEVMWGVWFMLDDLGPPEAMFGQEEAAIIFAAQANRPEWHVGPCVVDIRHRNNADVPERA